MDILIPLLKERWEGGHDLCPPFPPWKVEECGHGHPHPSSRKEDGREPWSLPLPHCPPLLTRRWEGGHGLCPSDLEK